MSAFDIAKGFFEACDSAAGWDGCKQYVANGASFVAQSEPLVDVTTVEAYCEWSKGFGTVTAPGATYELHSSSYDEKTRTAVFFATYHAKHTGEGGPVPPTRKETHTHYVYCITMNNSDKVERVVKIWNAPWAMRELGWM
jgi:hypothetical protein